MVALTAARCWKVSRVSDGYLSQERKCGEAGREVRSVSESYKISRYLLQATAIYISQ